MASVDGLSSTVEMLLVYGEENVFNVKSPE